MKLCGNKAVEGKHYQKAIDYYDKALKFGSDEPHAIYANRSYCKCQLGQYFDAIADADEIIKLKPNWGKGYVRKVTALIESGDLAAAASCKIKGMAYSRDEKLDKITIPA